MTTGHHGCKGGYRTVMGYDAYCATLGATQATDDSNTTDSVLERNRNSQTRLPNDHTI